MEIPHLTLPTVSDVQPAQKVRSTIYLGAEPYLSPPLSESAMVYGTLPSMRVVDSLIDDDGGGVLDIIHVGPPETHDRLTAVDAIVWRGVLTDTETRQIELFRREPDSESVDSQTWSVSAVIGFGDKEGGSPRSNQLLHDPYDVPAWTDRTSIDGNNGTATPTQALFPINTNHPGRLSISEYNIPVTGLSNDDKTALMSVMNRAADLMEKLSIEDKKEERKNMESELLDLKDWARYEAEHSDNPMLRTAYQCVVRLFASGSGNSHSVQGASQITSERIAQDTQQNISPRAGSTCSCKEILSQPCRVCHPQNLSGDSHDNHFQQILSQELTKLTAAWQAWVPRSAETPIINLMVKEIERLKDESAGNKLGYAVAPLDAHLKTWKIAVKGLQQTPYENGIFEIELDIASDWHQVKPEATSPQQISRIDVCGTRVITKIFHPDITSDGKMPNLEYLCLLVGFDLDFIAEAFVKLLSSPERIPKTRAARKGVSDMAKNQPDSFATMAREWTRRYAMGERRVHVRFA